MNRGQTGERGGVEEEEEEEGMRVEGDKERCGGWVIKSGKI